MSSDKEKLNQLSTRVDELIITSNKVTDELKSISASIKLLAVVAQNQSQTTVTPKPTTTSPLKSTYELSTTPTETNSITTLQAETKLRSLDDIRMSFPEDLETKLVFEDKEDYITVKPKQFLGSDNFAKIATTIRGMSGEYISAGKDSHFRVPKKKPTS